MAQGDAAELVKYMLGAHKYRDAVLTAVVGSEGLYPSSAPGSESSHRPSDQSAG